MKMSLTEGNTLISTILSTSMIKDIETPLIVYLKLLSWVRNENYDIKTIFLTTMDFNYAQKVIELQSFWILLKTD